MDVRRHRIRDRTPVEREILALLRGASATQQTGKARERDRAGVALRRLAEVLAKAGSSVLDIDAPFTSEVEERVIALLGDRQRQKRWRLSLPAPAPLDEATLLAAAEALRAEGLIVSHRTIVAGAAMASSARAR
ncbi:MAG: hypothetical protein IT548_12920 [Alphaproteobacteria bacterium]|nr:hypothetical protein [Alphaproteobacteria bacterium]